MPVICQEDSEVDSVGRDKAGRLAVLSPDTTVTMPREDGTETRKTTNKYVVLAIEVPK